jgi:hypothetical protein
MPDSLVEFVVFRSKHSFAQTKPSLSGALLNQQYYTYQVKVVASSFCHIKTNNIEEIKSISSKDQMSQHYLQHENFTF